MRILIAESKTMGGCCDTVSPDYISRHRPRLDSLATTLMGQWSEAGADKIVSALKVSPKLAAEFMKMAYEFPNKTTGGMALPAYTGVVFKALDYGSMSQEEQSRALETIDIISSLYGWLRGGDIVKPYRLDFSPRMAPGGIAMSAYLKPLVTPLLMESLEEEGENEVLDLLPSDAAKCVDLALLKSRGVRVAKAEFVMVGDAGRLKTPHSTLLKTLRGKLLREIVCRQIGSIDELASALEEGLSASFPEIGVVCTLS